MPNDTAPHRNSAPPRASREAPKEPTTLAELEEAVRERLHQHGQHGAIALFNKYAAEVNAREARSIVVPTADALMSEVRKKVSEDKAAKSAKPAKASKAKK